MMIQEGRKGRRGPRFIGPCFFFFLQTFFLDAFHSSGLPNDCHSIREL